MQTEGQPEAWNATWNDPDALFLRGTPRTLRQFWHRAYFEDLWTHLEAAGLAHPGRIVDACEQGSGRGTTSLYLATRGARTTLVDLAPNALAQAAAGFAREGLSAPTTVTADVRATGLPDASFDVVTHIGLLEHFDDPLPVLREALRLLRPGGLCFFVVVPDVPERNKRTVRALFTPWRLAPARLREAARPWRRIARHAPVFHRTATTTADWERWMAEAGARDIEVVPYNPFHPAGRPGRFERSIVVPLYRLWWRRRGLVTAAGSELCFRITARR
jgi:ubiquinone/menaquinone biosynthesis C-methylase UbiE